MRVRLPYGRGEVAVELPDDRVDVLLPEDARPLAGAKDAFHKALREPLGTPPLRRVGQGVRRACIVMSDWTRPTPNQLLVPWLLEELALSPSPPEHITVLVAAGTHKPPRGLIPEPWWEALPPHVEVVLHDASDREQLAAVGRTRLGEISLHHAYVRADLRVITGFIEPHFFAGFSGGGKAVMPGIAAVDNILCLHGPDFIAHEDNTWFAREGNPTQEAIVEAVRLCPPDFLVNVTMDREKRLTGFFCGDWLAAHRQGCDFCRRYSSVPGGQTYPVVVTTNGGYPLDQDLYQSVKGMSAAARITQTGGDIIMASACQAGIPGAGNFARLLFSHSRLEELLASVREGPAVMDQWEAQALTSIISAHRVHLYSELAPELVRDCFLHPVWDLSQCVQQLLKQHGQGARVGVLPLGPLAVPD